MIHVFFWSLILVGCSKPPESKREPLIVPIDQITSEPRNADYISITQDAFDHLIENLKSEAVLDSMLNVDAPGIFLIATSPYREKEYLIYPPFSRLTRPFPIEVSNRQGAIDYWIQCGSHQKACDCMNGISSQCHFSKFVLPRSCNTELTASALVDCKPTDLCVGATVCRKLYRFIKIENDSPFGWKAVAIGCECVPIKRE